MPRWILSLALLCGMLFAPIAMATACAPMPSAAQGAGHCAGDDGDEHAQTKQFQCMGACSGIEVGIARFAARMASPLVAIPIPTASSLSDVLLERDTPPPRLP